MLMSAGVEPPKGYAVGGWLLVGGEKMAKSGGNAVNPLELTELVGVDGFRYYVLAETPYGLDGDFTVEGLVARYNGDLANNLGNLASRVATVVAKKCDGIGPAPRADSPLAEAAASAYAGAAAGWDIVAPSRALEATWSLIRATNAFLEANEPWKSEPGAAVDAVMGDALEALRIVALLASPAVPSTSQEIWERIGLKGDIADQRLPEAAEWGGYAGGVAVVKGDPLFPRIT
jgi:methionyl-tRNA synthetase